MVQALLNNIRSMLNTTNRQNKEFKTESVRNNRNISSVLKDISKMFSSQSKSDLKLNRSMDNIESHTMSTSMKVDRSNSLLQESISIQTQMLSEIKNLSSIFNNAMINSKSGGAGGLGAGLATAAGITAGLTALGITGISPTQGIQQLTGVNFGGGQQGVQDGGGFADTSGGERLSVAELTKLAKDAGFNNEEAAIMGAIAAAESSGRTTAHNPNAGTGDNSYGLWQINMLGKMGPERRNLFGIESNNQLFDPKTNAMAARKIFEQQGFNAWSVYKSGAYKQYLGTAKESLKEGDETGAKASGQTSNGVNPQNSVMSPTGGNVYERQKELAGIRKLPLSDNLKRVLNQAAAAAGVDVVVYSGGQVAKGQKGPRTGSTRHDNGNAADLYLMKGDRKLSDTNAEDRAIMAKFVSAAVAAGATGGWGWPWVYGC